MRFPWSKRARAASPHELVLVDEPLVAADDRIVLATVRFQVSVEHPVPGSRTAPDPGTLVERVSLEALRDTASRLDSAALLEQGTRLADDLRWAANQTLPAHDISVGAASVTVRPHEPGMWPERTFRAAPV